MVPIRPGWFQIVWHGLPLALALAADKDDFAAIGSAISIRAVRRLARSG
jgi:hypothetical protein